MTPDLDRRSSARRTALKLLLVPIAMFGFGFAMVPLYEVFCDITGINGKTSSQRYEYSGDPASLSQREVLVQFVATNNESIGWEFRPSVSSMRVRLGAQNHTTYYAANTAGRDMVAQAVPSVSPGEAAAYMRKMECFCFERQTLRSGASRDMPLRFVLDPKLPKHIRTLTLSYTLFDVSDSVKDQAAL